MSSGQAAPGMDKLSDHSYDGIQEYDNPMPGWWVALFAASIVFAIGYFVYYESGIPERTVEASYTEEKTADLLKRFAGIGELKVTEANLVAWAQKDDYRLMGQGIFKANCISCHGPEGQGGVICPNLTDEYAKNIKRITDIPRVITSGANNGAMPAWNNRLIPNEISLVSAYVASLRGQNKPGRAPEGDLMPAWPKPLPAASAPQTQMK